MRLTSKVFYDVAIWMVSFGIAIGIGFPFFVMALGVPPEIVLRFSFFFACTLAGMASGVANYAIAKLVIGSRMTRLADVGKKMRGLAEELRNGQFDHDMVPGRGHFCGQEGCFLEVDSTDEIGTSAQAFNELAMVLSSSVQNELAVRMFNTMLTVHLEIEELSTEALRSLIRYTHSDGGAFLVDVEGELQVAATCAVQEPAKLAASDIVKSVAAARAMRRIVLPEHIQLDGLLSSFRPAEVILFPVVYKNVTLGLVVLGATRNYEEEDVRRLDLFGQGLSLALNNALVHGRIKRLATLDPMTGTYNRGFGLKRLREEYGRAVRAESHLGVLMMDIDHFKKINDVYGHQVGDRVIKSICRATKSQLREGDLFVRYGGEEFLLVLPAASSEDLRAVGERVRKSVEDLWISHEDAAIRATVSLGAAAFPDHQVESEDDLIRHADIALYHAKEHGRNRIILSCEIAKPSDRFQAPREAQPAPTQSTERGSLPAVKPHMLSLRPSE